MAKVAYPTKVSAYRIEIACNMCEKAAARYDAPTVFRGSWAHMCGKCFDRFGRNGQIGTIINSDAK